MSERRVIWRKAVHANSIQICNRTEGEKEFRKLLIKHGNDGMIFYERGEAFEFINEFEKAIEDYKESARIFNVEHWKMNADQGIIRVEKKKGDKYINEISLDDQWSIYHRIHRLNKIDSLTKFDALIALTLWDSEPCMTALILRSCLEIILLRFLPENFKSNNDDPTLEIMINTVQELRHQIDKPTDSIVYEKMHIVRRIGNDAAHPKQRERFNFEHFWDCAKEFIVTAEWVNEALSVKING